MTGTTVGVVGGRWRGTVTPWGAVVPGDGGPALDWWVASESRWHTPATDASVRQRLLHGVPVVETSLRVPGGDVVHRVYATAAAGGLTLVELENRSGRSVAVALSRRDVRTGRPIADVPIEGIELPPAAWVSPLAHGATIRVALAHDRPTAGPLPAGLPDHEQVARGWAAQLAGRLQVSLRDGALPVRVPARRAALLLDGPPDAAHDPAGFLLGARELAELGDDADAHVDAAAGAVAALARRHRRQAVTPWLADAALEAAAALLWLAGDARAAADAAAVRRRLPGAGAPPEHPDDLDDAAALGWLRRRLAVVDGDSLDVAPDPLGWLGRDVEAHGVLVPGHGPASFAVRWHGPRPALLWEAPPGVRLRSSGLDPSWATSEPAGEALLGVPPAASA